LKLTRRRTTDENRIFPWRIISSTVSHCDCKHRMKCRSTGLDDNGEINDASVCMLMHVRAIRPEAHLPITYLRTKARRVVCSRQQVTRAFCVGCSDHPLLNTKLFWLCSVMGDGAIATHVTAGTQGCMDRQ
jgi:hypothetical protein